MLMKIRNFLRGSIQVDIYGAAIERFLNLCSIHHVAFWNVEALDADHFSAWISVSITKTSISESYIHCIIEMQPLQEVRTDRTYYKST